MEFLEKPQFLNKKKLFENQKEIKAIIDYTEGRKIEIRTNKWNNTEYLLPLHLENGKKAVIGLWYSDMITLGKSLGFSESDKWEGLSVKIKAVKIVNSQGKEGFAWVVQNANVIEVINAK